MVTPESHGNGAGTLVSGGVGAAVGIIIGIILGRFFFSRGRAGYTQVPSVEEGASSA